MSFEEFYRQYYLNACLYATRKTGNALDGEELAANAFVYCYQHFSEYDPEKASIGTWLYVVLNSRIKNFYRDRKIDVPLDSLGDTIREEHSALERASELEEDRQLIAKALKVLPETQRAIVVYRYFQDRTSAETAEILGISEGSVRTQLSRALAKMRQVIKEEE